MIIYCDLPIDTSFFPVTDFFGIQDQIKQTLDEIKLVYEIKHRVFILELYTLLIKTLNDICDI